MTKLQALDICITIINKFLRIINKSFYNLLIKLDLGDSKTK